MLRRAGRSLPAHVRFLLGHAAIGVSIGVLFVAAVLALDVAGLRGLILRGADGWLALALLLFGSAVTFGSAAMGAAIMGLGAPPKTPEPPRGNALAAVPVRARR
jgi:hypothetical protein